MRTEFTLTLLCGAAVLLCGCPKKADEAARPLDSGTASLTQPQPTVPPPPPPQAQDAGAKAAADEAPDAALEGTLQDFSGFSGDESQFAFSVYSDGAGFYLLHVVGPDGKVQERFQLSDDAHTQKARAYLKARHFTSRKGPQELAQAFSAKVVEGKLQVRQGAQVVYDQDPFGARDGMGGPSAAQVAQVSPSGRRVAVKVEQSPVTEFGGITTYLLFDAGAQK